MLLWVLLLATSAAAQNTTVAPASTTTECTNHELPDGSLCPTSGLHLYPDTEHCSMYWECYQGCATHMLCQQDYLYDIEHYWCNYPNQVNCGDRDCDGRPCNLNTTPSPWENGTFPCPGDGYFPNEDNCIKYWVCSGGLAREEICPKANGVQELYNADNVWCDFPERVDCGTRPICDENDENCVEPATTPTPDNSTYSCPEENGYFPDMNNCIKYYICSLDHPRHETCPVKNGVQLMYDDLAIQCNWPEDVNCGDRPVCDTEDQNCVEATTPKPTACDKLTCQSGDFIIAEGPCEQCFCECTAIGNHPDELCCGPGLFFNPSTGQCDWPYNNDNC